MIALARHDLLFRPASEWPVGEEYEVVVAGAGPGGIGAAVGAARAGAATLIIEQSGYPGGVASACCCPYLMGFAAEGRQIVGGVGDELVRELDGMGHAAFMTSPAGRPEPRPIANRPLLANVITSVEGVRVGANRLLERAGVSRLYYSCIIGAVREGDRVIGVAVDGVDGACLIGGRAFVDATGDASLVWRAGGTVREYPVEESMTKTILLRVGGVPAFHRGRVEETFYRLAGEGKVPFSGQDRFMGFALLNPGEVLLNFTLAAGSGVRAADLTRMDIELREQALVTVEWFRREIPEFAGCYVVDCAPRVGVRAGRGIVGLETITMQDVDDDAPVGEPVALGTRGYGGHGVEGFRPAWGKSQGGVRPVPWRSLLSESLGNVAAAGRGISCDPRVIDTFRLMARCMATGQAAGITAALAARGEVTLVEVGYEAVRAELLAQRAVLE